MSTPPRIPESPLEHFRALGAHLGCELFVKRDDLLLFPLPGNKSRKLTAELGPGAARRAEVFITNGAAGSSHCCTLALLAARSGRRCHLVLHDEGAPYGPALRMLAALGACWEIVAPKLFAETLHTAEEGYAERGLRTHVIAGGCHTPAGERGGVRPQVIGVSVARTAERGRAAVSEAAMLDLVRTLRPHLLLSVNDFELDALAGGLGEEIRGLGTLVPGLTGSAAGAAMDKARMAGVLTAAGAPTPPTVLASDATGVRALARRWGRLVVKDRYGSGSSGLHIVSAADVDVAIGLSAQTLSTGSVRRAGAAGGTGAVRPLEPLERIVVQPAVGGQEYGLDLVGDLHGSGPCGVLARRKLLMREGETYRAVSVAREEFADTAAALAEALRPTGPVDVDLIRTPDGRDSVIDVNPRSGGGYAFSHMAGADVPLHYVQALAGRTVREDCLSYAPGLVAAKFVDVALTLAEPDAARAEVPADTDGTPAGRA
ncbi:ATP-grasp domain-containing protein [Brevibacterium album]|uniref:ATP-grasp domain-containing protein n=1 Tax=Brevibacterium album TaxID=417948 RepID=UPI00041CCE81|nr:ATP-grasp domain-containing protein [Brevibacterium album]